MKTNRMKLLIASMLLGAACTKTDNRNREYPMENLHLTSEWDKTFPKSDKVNHSKVTFVTRYGITLAADMYVPKETEGKLPPLPFTAPSEP